MIMRLFLKISNIETHGKNVFKFWLNLAGGTHI